MIETESIITLRTVSNYISLGMLWILIILPLVLHIQSGIICIHIYYCECSCSVTWPQWPQCWAFDYYYFYFYYYYYYYYYYVCLLGCAGSLNHQFNGSYTVGSFSIGVIKYFPDFFSRCICVFFVALDGDCAVATVSFLLVFSCYSYIVFHS